MAPHSDDSVLVSILVALAVFTGMGLWAWYSSEFLFFGVCVFQAVVMTPFFAWILRSLVCNWVGEAFVWWWKFWSNL